ncbi:MAG TPA: four helix bundle protein [Gemmatimonadales bacterium]|nr:four helix bundle protein [Gemmatimonadales bacterium]
MRACERLRAWELADKLAHSVFDATDHWPREERFGLVAQARRSAFSIPANICEGAAKHGRREFGRYLDIAMGSMAELSYTLRFAKQRGWIKDSIWGKLDALQKEAARVLWFLHRAIRNQKPQ